MVILQKAEFETKEEEFVFTNKGMKRKITSGYGKSDKRTSTN